jgi:hypothetical protein
MNEDAMNTAAPARRAVAQRRRLPLTRTMMIAPTPLEMTFGAVDYVSFHRSAQNRPR